VYVGVVDVDVEYALSITMSCPMLLQRLVLTDIW